MEHENLVAPVTEEPQGSEGQIAIEEQVRAYGGPQLQLIQEVMGKLATAIEIAKIVTRGRFGKRT